MGSSKSEEGGTKISNQEKAMISKPPFQLYYLLHGCNLSFKETCQFTLTLGGLLIHTVEILLVRDATNYLNPGMAFITTKIRRRGKRSNRLWLLQLPILKQLCLYLMQAHETDSKQNISKMLLFLQPHEQLTHILLIQQQ